MCTIGSCNHGSVSDAWYWQSSASPGLCCPALVTLAHLAKADCVHEKHAHGQKGSSLMGTTFKHSVAFLSHAKLGEKLCIDPDSSAPKKPRMEHKSKHCAPQVPPLALVTDPPPEPLGLTALPTPGNLSPLRPTAEFMLP